MRIGRIRLGAALVPLLLLPTVSVWAKSDTVRVADFQFTPSTLTISTGDVVIWKVTQRCCLFHTVSSSGSEPFFSDDLDVGQTFQYTFNQAGTYPYACANHAGEPPYGFNMVGSVIVVDPPSVPALQLLGLFLLVASLGSAAVWVLQKKKKAA